MPALREIEHALALEAELQERGIGAERRRRAAQLEVQPVRTRFAADDVARHRRVADAREYIEGGVAIAAAFGRGFVRHAHEQHALPAALHLRQARAGFGALALRVADLFLDEIAGELQLLQRDVHHRNDIARAEILDDRRAEQLQLEAMAVSVHAAVVPRELAAHFGIGAVAQARGEAMPAIRLRVHSDRHHQRFAIDSASLDVHGGEILTIVEDVLRAQQ